MNPFAFATPAEESTSCCRARRNGMMPANDTDELRSEIEVLREQQRQQQQKERERAAGLRP